MRVECSGLANANVMMVRGEYPGGPRGPWSPGYDVVGTVDAVGAGVEEFAVGERVAVLTKWGGCQQFLAWPAGKSVVKVPAGCEDSAKAVSVVLNGVTALQMLERYLRSVNSATWLQKMKRFSGHWVMSERAISGIIIH